MVGWAAFESCDLKLKFKFELTFKLTFKFKLKLKLKFAERMKKPAEGSWLRTDNGF